MVQNTSVCLVDAKIDMIYVDRKFLMLLFCSEAFSYGYVLELTERVLQKHIVQIKTVSS